MATVNSIRGSILSRLPDTLRNELLEEYNKIIINTYQKNWEGVLLDGGRFCEHVFEIVRHTPTGDFPDHAVKPRNFVDDCLKVRNLPNMPLSFRTIIPFLLITVYSMRNHRDSGHATKGDICSNEADALFVVRACKWMLTELIRVLDVTDIDQAVDTIRYFNQRELPIIWRNPSSGIERILDEKTPFSLQILLLLYSSPNGQSTDNELIVATEYTNSSTFKNTLLKKLHQQRLVDYDRASGLVTITSKGCLEVESSAQLRTFLT